MSKKRIFTLVAMISAIAACSKGTFPEEVSEGKQSCIELSVDDFQDIDGLFAADEDVRSTITVSTGGKFNFTWEDGDALGVFPGVSEQAQQMMFTVKVNEIGKETFNGATIGWQLNKDIPYAAYYPIIEKFSLKPSEISYEYTGQTQTGNGNADSNLAHLGAYDFLRTAPTELDEAGNAQFKFKHIGAIVRFHYTALYDGQYTSFTIRIQNGEEIIPQTINLDLFGTPAITPEKCASSFTVGLNDFTTKRGEFMNIWMMFPPVDLSDSKLVITFKGDENTTDLEYTIDGRNFESSKAYSINDEGTVFYEYTLVYDANGGTINGKESESVTSGKTIDESHTFTVTTTPALSDKGEFLGWATTSSATEAEYTANDEVTISAPNSSLTLYAVYNTTEPYETLLVDMGLPSGTLWASCNLGANSEKDFGNYYTFGDPDSRSEADCTAQNYKWYASGKDSSAKFKKYVLTKTYGNPVDGRSIIEDEDNAAIKALGGHWDIPTAAQMQELLDNTTRTVIYDNTTQLFTYKQYQIKFTAKNAGKDGKKNSIILPKCGYIYIGKLYNNNLYGGYRTKNIDKTKDCDCYLWFYAKSNQPTEIESISVSKSTNRRCDGLPIRPVNNKDVTNLNILK